MSPTDLVIPATDGYQLAATLFKANDEKISASNVVVINSATGVPRKFYRSFAQFLQEHGYTVVTYDYRGIAGSAPKRLRGFEARIRDWALRDMQGVVGWVSNTLQPSKLIMIGHSVGGQVAGMLEDGHKIDAMVTISAQSGYWSLQGGNEPLKVRFMVTIAIPLLTTIYGYLPWSKFLPGEDLPKGVALEWAGWCRHPEYLLGDSTLPLERYANFKAPILAYSIDDDDWGTARSVDAMMKAYPNVERRHIVPAEFGVEKLGHMGYFRAKSSALWEDALEWLEM